MKALMLHIMSDALGSLAVIISSLCIWFVDADWVMYLDPACSLVIVVITVASTWPVFKSTAIILMQVQLVFHEYFTQHYCMLY